MCRWLQVVFLYTCEHINRLPDAEIQCDDRYCKFSSTHPVDCGENCKNTCWQYRQFPDQRTRTQQLRCPCCEQNAQQTGGVGDSQT